MAGPGPIRKRRLPESLLKPIKPAEPDAINMDNGFVLAEPGDVNFHAQVKHVFNHMKDGGQVALALKIKLRARCRSGTFETKSNVRGDYSLEDVENLLLEAQDIGSEFCEEAIQNILFLHESEGEEIDDAEITKDGVYVKAIEPSNLFPCKHT